jgi:Flp pilus assembly secretin CpaC
VSRTPAVLIALLLLLLPAAARAGDAGRPAPAEAGARVATSGELTIAVGAQVVLDRPGLARVSVGDPSVADVTMATHDQVLVTGVAPGRTTLILWLKSGKREVHDVVVTDTGRLSEVRGTLEVLGLGQVLAVKAAGRHLVVEGTLHTLAQLRRFDQLRRAEPGLFSLVRVDPAIYQRLADEITAALHRAGLTGAHATAISTTVFLEGTVSDPAEKKQADDIARAIWGQIETGRLETR